MEEKLTSIQAYKAMFIFIEEYYNRLGKPIEIGNLLSDIQLLRDRVTLDPAAWEDWLKAIRQVQQDENT